MEYTLENLHKLVQAVSPDIIKPDQLSGQQINSLIAEAANERELIQVRLMKDMFNIEHERTLEIFITTIQLALIGFADKLTGYTKQLTKKSKLTGLYQDILFIIDSILTFIEHHFSKYFNLDAKVPEAYYQVAQNEMKRKLEGLNRTIGKLEIDRSLLEIVSMPLKEFTNEKNTDGITYRRLIYLKELHNELKNFISNDKVERNSGELVNLLLYLNFNHVLFFNYFIDLICTEIVEVHSISERIEKLSLQIKTINQVHYRPGVSLNIDYPFALVRALRLGSWHTNHSHSIMNHSPWFVPSRTIRYDS